MVATREMVYGVGALSHLGGYIKGGDIYGWVPEVWARLVELGSRSVVDVGCGEGHVTRWFLGQGIPAIGVDGVPQPFPYIIQHDYTEGPLSIKGTDLAWCCEFLEHVDEQYQSNYMATFASCSRVACTAAPPGSEGHHHVNCRLSDYWIEAFDKYGFDFNRDLTVELRGMVASRSNFFTQSGMVFDRRVSE